MLLLSTIIGLNLILPRNIEQVNYHPSDEIIDERIARNNVDYIYNSFQEDKTLFESYEKILYIGDSRTVGLRDEISNNHNIEFVCKVGQGLNWFKKQNLKDKIIDKDTLVLINLGVNDLGNLNKYIDYINELNVYNNIYFISVNPVNETTERKYGYSIKNSSIEDFNKKMKENFNYIDTYSYLVENGFSSKDGIHYTRDTYLKIYNFIENYKDIENDLDKEEYI